MIQEEEAWMNLDVILPHKYSILQRAVPFFKN